MEWSLRPATPADAEQLAASVSEAFQAYRDFAAVYPAVPIHPERVLVISGLREELISSGASTTWHDMVLYLIARYAGATDALRVARMYALQWHLDGLAPYISFEGKSDHGDAEIQGAQRWLSTHFSVANPVEEMIKRSKLAERTYQEALKAVEPDDLATLNALHYRLGRVAEAQGNRDAAEEHYNEVAANDYAYLDVAQRLQSLN